MHHPVKQTDPAPGFRPPMSAPAMVRPSP
jgi:hypothetical protein